MKRKLTVNQFALSSLKHRKKQYSVLFIGIILAMVFSSAVPFFISCAKASQKEMHNRQLGNQDLLVINSMTIPLRMVLFPKCKDKRLYSCPTSKIFMETKKLT